MSAPGKYINIYLFINFTHNTHTIYPSLKYSLVASHHQSKIYKYPIHLFNLILEERVFTGNQPLSKCYRNEWPFIMWHAKSQNKWGRGGAASHE